MISQAIGSSVQEHALWNSSEINNENSPEMSDRPLSPESEASVYASETSSPASLNVHTGHSKDNKRRSLSTDITSEASQKKQKRLPKINIGPHFLNKLRRIGATSAPPPKQGDDLEIIHDIFKLRHWNPEHFPADKWEAMQPALRLASQFLCPKTRLFDDWVRLTHVESRRHETSGYFELENHRATPREIIDTVELLSDISRAIRFYAHPISDISHRFDAYTRTAGNDDAQFTNFDVVESPEPSMSQRRLQRDGMLEPDFIAININPFFLESVDPSKDDPDQVRRHHFTLAIIVVHEISHAVWSFVHADLYAAVPPCEPCLPEANLQELLAF